MKKLWIILALLCPSFAWGTAYTSAASGNWNSSATWSPSGVPGSGDTVTLANGYTVTIPVSTTATVSSIACLSATGTGILIINGTLDYKGSTLNQCSANPWICNSCTLTADDASTSIQWNIGYANCTTAPCALLVLNGTSSSPVTVNGTGGSTWSFAGGGYQDAGAILATWGSFANCGTSSIACINVNSYYFVGLKASITYSTFTSTGLVGLGNVNPGNSTSFIFNHNTIITPIDSSGKGLSITTAGNDSTIACQIENNYLEGETFETIGASAYWGTDDGCIVNGNAFIGSATASPYVGNLSGHATGHFDGNLFYNQLGANVIFISSGSVTRSVILLVPNESGGGPHLYGFGAGEYANTVFNGGTVERQYNSVSGADGTSSCFYNGGVAFASTIENWVTIPAPNGGSPCMLSNAIGAVVAGGSYTVLHNTAMVTPVATGGGFGPCAGEGSTATAGLYPQCSNNMFWSTSSAAGVGAGWYNSSTPTANTFTVADYNGWYNVTGSPYTAKYIPNSAAYASTPGTHDVTANPNFPGCYNGSTTAVANCNFKTWGQVQGISVSTWADIIAQFKCMNAASGCLLNNASIMAYYYWTRQGFTPLNTALHGTASDGGDIGAIPYLAVVPPQFSGLLTSTTDLTTSGSWTTPATPASGASYVDSIFGITANRIPAVTGTCPANGTYNPTGDCAITNRQMEVDYAKTVPWSVDNSYYVGVSNGWLMLYSRSSLGVYTFIRTLRTWQSGYGSTRDYGTSDSNYYGLWGDFSNWLWANNASSSPDTIYYTGSTIASPNRTQLKAYHADTDTITVVHDFAPTIATVNGWGTCGVTANAVDMQREGNQSDDDNNWVFMVSNGTASHICAVLDYNKATDTVIALQTLAANGICGVPACSSLHTDGYPNWVGSTPSGGGAIINWQDSSSYDTTWTPHEGTELYTNLLAYTGVISSANGHGDTGWDANGIEVYVDQSSAIYVYGNYAFQVCNLSQVNMNAGYTGCRRYLSVPCTYTNTTCPVGSSVRGNTYFISMRGTHGTGLGWMALSTQTAYGATPQSVTGNGGWGALENDAIFIDWANGSMNATVGTPPATSVTRIGRNHAILVYDGSYDQDYNSQVNAAVDRTFSKMAWTTNMDVAPTSSCESNSANCNYYSMYTELGGSSPSNTVTTSTTGTGSGTVTGCPTGSYTDGSTVNCTATASGGSTFAGWSGTCGLTGTTTPTSFTMPSSDCTVIATFSGGTSYTLTVSTTTGTGTGTINITNNCQTGSFTSGTTIGPCTATPDGGSVFAGWTGTLGCTGTGTCTASLTGNSTMNAVFNLAPTSAPVTMQGIGSIQGTAVIQ